MKKRSRFSFGWFFAISIPLVIVIASLYLFSKLLYGFEYYSPAVTVEDYFELIRNDQYEQAMDMVGIEGDQLNDRSRMIAYFKDLYGDKIESVAYAERKLQRTEDKVYIDAYINGKTTQKFVLTKTGEKRMRFFDTWTLALVDDIPKTSVTIHIPVGISLKVNGIDIGESHRVEPAGYVIDKYKNLKDDNKFIETRTYKVGDLMKGFEIEAVSDDGEACELVAQDEDEDGGAVYIVKRSIPESQLQEMKAVAENITKRYSEFVANDIKFHNFAPYVYQNSKLYDDLKEFYNAWFTPHDDYGFEEVSFFDIEAYDDTHYTLGVEFVYYVHRFNKRFDYPVRYHVYLLKVGDKWMLAELSIE